MSRCTAIGICGLALLNLASAGCRPSASPPAEPQRPPQKKATVIGVSQSNAGEPWHEQMNKNIQAAAQKHPELEVVFQDAADDPLKQCVDVEKFIAARVKLIIISPTQSQPLTEPVAKAIDAKIPVNVLDRAVIGDKYTCFLGADNKKIGFAAGTWLAQKLGGKGKIVELEGLMTSTAAQDRHSGFRAAIRDPGYRVIFEADIQWKQDRAREEMAAALSQSSEIDAVYAHSDQAAYGAYQAAKAANREKRIIFVGIDALPREGVAYVAQGILDASFEYPTGGAEAIETALKILHGETVPKRIPLRSRVFTKENVAHGGDPLE